ncbi:MAG TPA: ribosome-associated translation inhibitor RaiA [Synergistaceae bacterium]|jgi:putative sigma-54 modulation protein|nr:ribosome-associated translation inhibitor RaiA [Synergistaceae bacterium]
MDIRFVTRGVEVQDDLKGYMENKMSKLEKFFNKILDSQIVTSFGRGLYTVEVTTDANGVIMRGQESASDMRKAFDQALKNLERQIKRHNAYLKDRAQLKTHDISFDLPISEPQEKAPEAEKGIVKMKRFPLRPMTAEEATMQMDLLGHEFFLFKNADSGAVNAVYKRKNGGYGLLEPME